MPNKDGMWRICGLDGGGARGVITLEVLRALEMFTGKRIADLFDLVVGTSTGGLLALGLTKEQPLSAAALLSIYQRFLPLIFRRSTTQKVKSLGQLAGPKYNNEALYECALQIVGGKAQMRNTVTSAMVTTYDMAKRTPRFYTSWDTPDVLQIDAAMSTTAAPTYFAPWHNNVDGGVCDNNPALSGVVELCKRQGCTVRDVLCLSVGTGSDAKPYEGAEAAKWGLLTWAEPLVSLFTDGTSELHAYHLQRLMPDQNLMRLQCQVDGELAELDNASGKNIDALHTAGVKLATGQARELEAFAERLL